MFEDIGITKYATAGYNPEADGAAENMIKLLVEAVSKLARQRGGDWEDWVWVALMALRARTTGPYKMSPYRARFGVEMVLPSFFDVPLGEIKTADTREARRIYETVLPRLRDQAAARMKKHYDKGRKEVTFKVGNWVWLRRQVRNKVEPRRDGPFRVKTVKSPLTYVLEELAQGPKLGTRSPVQNVKHLDLYEQKLPVVDEQVVSEVLKHKKMGRKKKYYKYLVKWADGDETWERAWNLIDDEEKENQINEALQGYWDGHPGMQKEEGY